MRPHPEPFLCCVEQCCPEGCSSVSVNYVVFWKQEKRLCFWMAVLALYERSLARSQDPAPREGRLMTASHGKALQQQRAKERNIVGEGSWREGREGENKGEYE